MLLYWTPYINRLMSMCTDIVSFCTLGLELNISFSWIIHIFCSDFLKGSLLTSDSRMPCACIIGWQFIRGWRAFVAANPFLTALHAVLHLRHWCRSLQYNWEPVRLVGHFLAIMPLLSHTTVSLDKGSPNGFLSTLDDLDIEDTMTSSNLSSRRWLLVESSDATQKHSATLTMMSIILRLSSDSRHPLTQHHVLLSITNLCSCCPFLPHRRLPPSMGTRYRRLLVWNSWKILFDIAYSAKLIP